MGIQNATRSQILLALRRTMPNVSMRRLGDMIDGAQLLTLESQKDASMSLAFGLVLDGTLRVTGDSGETRWVGPGDIFGMMQYELNPGDNLLLLKSTVKTVRYLAFSAEHVAKQGFARGRPLSK